MAVDNKYITVAYKLYTIEDGEEDEEPVEVANQRHPFQFISGFNLVLPAFEANIAPLDRGDEFDFVIPFKDAYGEFNEELMFDVPESVFMVDGKIDFNYIHEGAVVPMMGEDGSRFNATIIEIKKDSVTIDLNHPRAGQDLHFVGHVVEARPATNEEITDMLNASSECGCCEGGDCGSGGCGGCGGCNGGGCGGC
ncbi:MAG: FKBP-type peptidyl-prolyl cis-trans isomerase [Bacteroidaceae bacterium]|nr:FKBP-type peptidyl-prolyl cis-trans isomerase [Bacteroidaceae bacterium]